MEEVFQTRFKGFRDDIGANFTSHDYFRVCENVSFDDLDGANKVLFPEEVNTTEFAAGYDIDGGYEYRYLDASNVLQTRSVVVSGGQVFIDILATPTSVYSGLTANKKCRFVTFQDKLIITNGVDYPIVYDGNAGVVYELGAPYALESTATGNPTGAYYYALTYVTTGGEEVLGTVSNTLTVAGKQLTVTLPLGYAGVTSRKLYRTEAGGSTLKLVTTIADNTTLSYTDNTADGALGATIPAINNEMPKPYFIETSYNRLLLAVTDKEPTQIFPGETGREVVDNASFSDVSNIGNDNTPCTAMTQQFSLVAIGTEKNWYLADVSGTASIEPTSVNVGCADGYSAVNIPSNANFPGGTMFLSSNNDFRLLGGLSGLIPNTINNITTENWSQQIKGTLDNELSGNINIFAEAYNDTYHVIVGDKILTFNTRSNSWSTILLRDVEDNLTVPNVLFVLGNELYVGKKGESKIERMYSDIQYKGVEYKSIVRSASIPTYAVGEGFSTTSENKYFTEMQFYYLPSLNYKLNYKIVIDGDEDTAITGEYTCKGGVFDKTYFSSVYFDTGSTAEDYFVVRINRFGEYIHYELTSDEGLVHYRGYRLKYEPVRSQEG